MERLTKTELVNYLRGSGHNISGFGFACKYVLSEYKAHELSMASAKRFFENRAFVLARDVGDYLELKGLRMPPFFAAMCVFLEPMGSGICTIGGISKELDLYSSSGASKNDEPKNVRIAVSIEDSLDEERNVGANNLANMKSNEGTSKKMNKIDIKSIKNSDRKFLNFIRYALEPAALPSPFVPIEADCEIFADRCERHANILASAPFESRLLAFSEILVALRGYASKFNPFGVAFSEVVSKNYVSVVLKDKIFSAFESLFEEQNYKIKSNALSKLEELALSSKEIL